MDLDTIVDISVTADSRAVTAAGFGTPLVLTYHTRFVERYRSYTSLKGMTSDGFTTVDDAYRGAASAFAQNPRPKKVIVGRLPAAPSFVTQLTITSATAGQHVRLKVIAPAAGTLTDPVVTGGVISPTGALLAGTVVSIDYTIQAAATTTTVATAVEALIEAVPGVDSAPAVAVISITPTTAGRRIYVYDIENANVQETTAAAGYDTELSNLQIENDDWYFITADSTSQANVNAIAAWTLSRRKLYFARTQSSYELDGTGTLGSTLKALTNNRTVLIYTPNAHEWADVAFASKFAVKTPGSITGAFKELTGVTAKTLSDTQATNLETDNINHYQYVSGFNITFPAKCVGGEWIDIVHGVDALQSAVQASVFAVLVGADKVPFTASGLDLIGGAILGALKRFEGTLQQPGLIAIDTSWVLMPELEDLLPADVASRILDGVTFGGDLAGAVHFVRAAGSLVN